MRVIDAYLEASIYAVNVNENRSVEISRKKIDVLYLLHHQCMR